MKQNKWFSKLKNQSKARLKTYTEPDSLKELEEEISNVSKDKEEAESKVKTLKEALDKNDIEAIKKEKDALQETLYKLAAKVYENTNASNNTTTEEKTEDKKDDSVKDAEFEEK